MQKFNFFSSFIAFCTSKFNSFKNDDDDENGGGSDETLAGAGGDGDFDDSTGR